MRIEFVGKRKERFEEKRRGASMLRRRSESSPARANLLFAGSFNDRIRICAY